MERVVQQIETAVLVVAVLVGNHTNVLYEVGLAHALQKRVAMVTEAPEKNPFDVKDFQCIVYDGGNDDLAKALFAEQFAISGNWFVACQLPGKTAYRCKFVDHATARAATFSCIEGWYNRGRLHPTLGYVRPVEYERRTATPN